MREAQRLHQRQAQEQQQHHTRAACSPQALGGDTGQDGCHHQPRQEVAHMVALVEEKEAAPDHDEQRHSPQARRAPSQHQPQHRQQHQHRVIPKDRADQALGGFQAQAEHDGHAPHGQAVELLHLRATDHGFRRCEAMHQPIRMAEDHAHHSEREHRVEAFAYARQQRPTPRTRRQQPRGKRQEECAKPRLVGAERGTGGQA